MVIVSPIITFSIGAVASNDPSLKRCMSESIKMTIDYINGMSTPSFKKFVNEMKGLQYTNQDTEQIWFTMEDCVDFFEQNAKEDLDIALKLFNDDPEYPTYAFYDKCFCCAIIDPDLYLLDYESTREYKFIMDHKHTIYKVHTSMLEKYPDMEEHVMLLVNFLITFRNWPLANITVIPDGKGNYELK